MHVCVLACLCVRCCTACPASATVARWQTSVTLDSPSYSKSRSTLRRVDQQRRTVQRVHLSKVSISGKLAGIKHARMRSHRIASHCIAKPKDGRGTDGRTDAQTQGHRERCMAGQTDTGTHSHRRARAHPLSESQTQPARAHPDHHTDSLNTLHTLTPLTCFQQ